MKKITTYEGKKIINAAIMLAGFLIATSTFAATVSFLPASINVKEGQDFNAGISVDSQGQKVYTVKLQITYPVDVVEITSFNLGTGWTALVQPGYDLIDNKNGILIKTGGYPGGLNAKTSFGTIIFKSKKSGTGVVRVTADSLALGADNKNTMTGLPVDASVIVTPITFPSISPVTSTSQKPNEPKKTPAVSPTSSRILPTSSSEPAVTVSPEQTVQPTDSPKAGVVQTAQAIGGPTPSRSGLSAILLILGVGVIGYIVWIVAKRKKS